MSEKEKLNKENMDHKELSPAERILQRISQKKEETGQTVADDSKINPPIQEEMREEIIEENRQETEEVKEVPKETFSSEETVEEHKKEDTPTTYPEEVTAEDKKLPQEDVQEENAAVDKQPSAKEPEVDYAEFDKTKLLKTLNELVRQDSVLAQKEKINALRKCFYDIFNTAENERRNRFVAEGGQLRDYEPLKDPEEIAFKELLKKYKAKKEAEEQQIAAQKERNAVQKYAIIAEIKELINKPGEHFNVIYNHFKELQKKWNTAGPVPAAKLRDLDEEYNIQVQKFYEYVNVNKELRELDHRKNLEKKTSLCERAEALQNSDKITEAKKELQNLHAKWKEIGPVSNEIKEEIWNRFQEASKIINHKFSEYINEIKEQQSKNLESKTFLIEKAREFAEKPYESESEWREASNKMVELQTLWKKIGYVPKEHNTRVYEEFKAACDHFFERIRLFYQENDKVQEANYEKKIALCVQAENMQDSTDWNKTTQFYKDLQAEWKTIGPVPRKHANSIWKRFRTACNTFFDNKKEHFKGKKELEKENLAKKQAIIEQVEKFEGTGNQIEDLARLKQIRQEFLAVGHVPYESKDKVYDLFQETMNQQLEKLQISRTQQTELRFSENLEIIQNSPNAEYIAQKEIGRLQNKIDKLQEDIKIWENNVGFFSNSENSKSMIQGIENKINNAKEQVKLLKKQISELKNVTD